MSITVSGRKMPVTDALRAYAEEKIGNSMKVMDIDPLNAEVVLSKEKNPANPCPDTCEVTLRTKGHIIRVEEHEDDMYAAIDVAAHGRQATAGERLARSQIRAAPLARRLLAEHAGEAISYKSSIASTG